MTEVQIRSMEPGQSTGTDRQWLIRFAFLVLLVTSLPYVFGFFTQGSTMRFTGFVFAMDDGNSYIAKMLSGSQGAWLFRTPYTTMPQGGLLVFLPYLLLGKLAAGPALHEQLVALYHLYRLAAGFALILATYDFICYFIPSIQFRRRALVVAVLGSGLGWVLLLTGRDQLWGSLPLEYYSPETFGFLGLYGLPHLALARALLLWALNRYMRMVQDAPQRSVRLLIEMSVLWLLLGVVQLLNAVILAVVIGLHLLALLLVYAWHTWRVGKPAFPVRTAWQTGLRIALLTGWPVGVFLIYNVWTVYQDAYLSNWTAQNQILSPHPGHYLLAYGILLPFVVMGGWRLWQRSPVASLLLIAWVVGLPVLVYFPFGLQRRMSDGVWVALVVLAVLGYEKIKEHLPGWRQNFLLLPIWLTLPGSLLLVAGGCLAVQHPVLPLFRPLSEVTAFQWLASHAPANAVVLSSYSTGNALPAWAPLKVVFGHGPETANFNVTLAEVSDFYRLETTHEERLAVIKKHGVDYLWWGPAEKSLSSGYEPRSGCLDTSQAEISACTVRLIQVYQPDEIQVFEVLP